ncbi:Uronate isomerase [Aquimixticola soesokkakensis]|uniref:Uronate isomerase n=1 Tax=Aquimixticola soesokkakensis TaxID=1519096 RepID=A0A1Y5RQJ1_9RHOB|nr:glucuronate isomerase [Aquimixticola soesokkakensis]SLN23013.1 Uronate isomerase [Aquimixticola soesokkakensis]
MSAFLNADFLLDTATARRLYHEVAADLPIIDYHNHLPPAEIAADHHWDNLGELWLAHDHYKWRMMRWAGIEEARVSGTASWHDKFNAYAQAMPRMVLNPVHHWSHLELWRYFDLDGTVLSPQTADAIWEQANAKLAEAGFGARGLLAKMKVEFVGTTDDPCDTLEHHAALRGAEGLVVAPSFRPDTALKVEAAEFAPYIDRLAGVTGAPIRDFDALVGAMVTRLDHFVAHGCKASDHGLELLDAGDEVSGATLDDILRRRLDTGMDSVTSDEAASLRAALLVALGRAYAERDIVMQLHIGPLRNTSSRLLHAKGRDAGGDGVRDRAIAEPLNALLDRLDRTNELPRTVLYCVDATKNAILTTTAASFQDGSVAGKVQVGTGWWHADQLDGMERQMIDLTQMGLISTFLGMLTDSRSFLSFPRHEYFRRLLCRLIGRWAETGHLPDDPQALEGLVRDISYTNARRWFIE